MNIRAKTPVVVFAYRRADHLRRTLQSLVYCKDYQASDVIIYCDGPRNASELDSVIATRELARNILGDHAEYHFSEVNLGLSRSVMAGVSDAINRFGRAIVLEDDLELSPLFITFMNQALDRYANDENVFQISGYMFDVPELKTTSSALFLPFTSSWGWATWKRAWDQFDPQASGWEALRSDKVSRRRFNLDGTYDYATMLVRQMEGLIDSWAVRWYWSVFKANGLVLFPPVSLVGNNGLDGSGTHGSGLFRRFSKFDTVLPSPAIDLPKSVYLNAELYSSVKKSLVRQNSSWIGKSVDKLRWWKATYFNKQKIQE